MPTPRIEKHIGPAKRELFKALRAYNVAACGPSGYQPFVLTYRSKGKIVGGLFAEIYWGWMYVNHIWISEEHRGKGWGRALMRKAEAEARKRGVRNSFLESFSFQAPRFYAKLGYREFGRVNDFPKGHSRHWMTKAL
jgi:GNAT superfamily N-acetyltransferase